MMVIRCRPVHGEWGSGQGSAVSCQWRPVGYQESVVAFRFSSVKAWHRTFDPTLTHQARFPKRRRTVGMSGVSEMLQLPMNTGLKTLDLIDFDTISECRFQNNADGQS